MGRPVIERGGPTGGGMGLAGLGTGRVAPAVPEPPAGEAGLARETGSALSGGVLWAGATGGAIGAAFGRSAARAWSLISLAGLLTTRR